MREMKTCNAVLALSRPPFWILLLRTRRGPYPLAERYPRRPALISRITTLSLHGLLRDSDINGTHACVVDVRVLLAYV